MNQADVWFTFINFTFNIDPMNRNYIYSFTLALLILASAGIYFFKNSGEETPTPQLLERQGPIATTSEWLNTKAAIKGLEYNLRTKPADKKNKLLLALAYMQEARVTGQHPHYYPAALELVEDVIDTRNIDEDLLYEATVAKASIQLSLHQFNKALKTGNKALAINNKRASVYGVLCDAYLELGHYEKAIEMADQMTAIRPDLKSYARVSYLREIHGDLPGAIEAMEMAARAGFPGLEQTAWTKFTLGGLYEKVGDLQQADAIYRETLLEYPNYAFAYAGLARIEAKKGNDKAAIELYEKASNIIPEFSFQEGLAHIYKKQGQKLKATKTTKELLEGLEEDQESGHVMNMELAQISMDLQGDYDKALHYTLKEYKERPNNIDVNKTLAKIYYNKNDLKKAVSHINKASITNSQDPGLLCLKGLIAYKAGDRQKGQELVQKSFETNPFMDDAIAHEGRKLLGKTLSKL